MLPNPQKLQLQYFIRDLWWDIECNGFFFLSFYIFFLKDRCKAGLETQICLHFVQ